MRSSLAVAVIVLGGVLLLLLLGGEPDPRLDREAIGRDADQPPLRLEGLDPGPGAPEPSSPPPPAGAVAPAWGSLAVTCAEEASSRVVPGVEVVLVARHGDSIGAGRTDGRGETSFPRVPVGAVDVRVAGGGWFGIDEVDVQGATHHRLELVRAVALEGRVVASTDGRGIEGADVSVVAGGQVGGSLLLKEARRLGRAVTDRHGAFRLAALPRTGIVTASARAKGYIGASVGVRPAAGEVVRIVLRPGGTLTGRVEGSGGPVSGATVVVAEAEQGEAPDPEADGALVVVTDAEGRFTADGLPLDVGLAAQADAEGLAESAPLALRLDGMAKDISLRLPDAAVVRIRVTGPDGQPRPDVAVGVGFAPFLTGLLHAEGRTDADGRARFEGLNLGRTLLRVEAPGFVPWRKRVTLKEGELCEADVVLDPGAAVTGRVVDDLGAPLEGAIVLAERSFTDGDAKATTDASGVFRITGLVPERVCEVRAYADGHAAGPRVEVEAPTAGVRIALAREGVLKARLVLPPGVAAPPRQIIETVEGRSQTIVEGSWKGGIVRHALAPGTYRVALYGEGLQRTERAVTIASGEEVDLGDLFLEPARHWRVVVVDTEGTPVAGARVILVPNLLAPFTTDEEGRFELPDPGSLPQTLAVKADGYEDLIEVIEEAPDGPLRIVLEKRE